MVPTTVPLRAALMMAAIWLALAALPAAAKVDDEPWDLCAAGASPTALSNCTSVIENEGLSGADLGMAHYNRGIAWWRKGQHERANDGHVSDAFERALTDYGRAIELAPDDPRPFVNRGIVHAENGRHEQAIADYDRALALRPDLPEAVNNRALAYLKLGRYELAQRDFDRVIVLVKNWGNALINRPVAPARPPVR